MKKRYIDFVPAKGKTPVKKVTAVKKPVVKAAPKPVAKPAPKKISRKEVPLEELFAEKPAPKKAKLGVIEDYKPVVKKPVAPKPVAPKPKPVAKKPPYVAPKPVFLNTSKVEKRPLSMNVPQRKQPVVPPKEVAPIKAKPEKIIAKPEKDSKAGLIIAIILTIILGAAAGTIAFLLLPK